MKPRISVITLGVDNLEKSVQFYRDGLRLKTDGIIGRYLRANKPGVPHAPQDHEARMVARWGGKPKKQKRQGYWPWLAAAALLLGVWGLWPSPHEKPPIEPILLSMVEAFDSIEQDWDDEIYDDWLSLGRLISSSQ